MNKKKVLVGVSGGLDSSVACILLKEQGFEPIGITFKIWDSRDSVPGSKQVGSDDDIRDAKKLCDKLNIPHHVVDVREPFKNQIIQNFKNEYLNGRTPNPCVLCNRLIKWKYLLEYADKLNCGYYATGHYARIKEENGLFFVSEGKDKIKDQSYFLWSLSSDFLSRTLFPLGNYTKKEIAEIAKKNGFTSIAEKKESLDICFIPDKDYRNFLNQENPELKTKLDQGKFVNRAGEFLGYHKGYPYYTVGQRKGLEIALGVPMYVLEIIPEKNIIVLGEREELYQDTMRVKNYTLSKYREIDSSKKYTIRIRYNNQGTAGRIYFRDNHLEIKFDQAVSAIAPGQSAVFYEGEDLIGGGIIL